MHWLNTKLKKIIIRTMQQVKLHKKTFCYNFQVDIVSFKKDTTYSTIETGLANAHGAVGAARAGAAGASCPGNLHVMDGDITKQKVI